jgi:hypothetical protein
VTNVCLHACLLFACEGCTPAVQAGSRIVLLGCTATANVVRAVLSATRPFVSILQPYQDRTGHFPHLLCRSLPPLHFHVFSPKGTLSVCLSSLLKWGSLVLPSPVRPLRPFFPEVRLQRSCVFTTMLHFFGAERIDARKVLGKHNGFPWLSVNSVCTQVLAEKCRSMMAPRYVRLMA